MVEQEEISWGWAKPQWLKNQWVTYKLTHSEWKKLWERQNGRCAGCGKELAHPLLKELRKGLKPETDHLHREGKQCETADVRGLLCHRCNSFLGKIRDNMDILQGLLLYLKQHGDL